MSVREKQSVLEILIFDSDYCTSPIPVKAIVCDAQCATLSTSFAMEESALSPKKTYPYMNRQVPGQSVEFESKSEPWAQYTLSDGTEVKVKMVLMDAARLDEFTEQGEPVYQFQFQQILGIVAPDALKRKPQ